MRAFHLACCLCVLAVFQTRAAEISAEARECFEWFNTLGHPDIRQAPWAEIWYGRGSQVGNHPPEIFTKTGFVFEKHGDRFTVLTRDLTSATLTMSGTDASKEKRIGFEKRSLHDAATILLERLRHPPADSNHGMPAGEQHFEMRLTWKAEVFFMAFACSEQQEPKLAQALFDEAKKISSSPAAPNTPVGDMKLELEQEFADQALWRGMVWLGGGELGWNDRGFFSKAPLKPRRELQEYFRKVTQRYPRSQHFDLASHVAHMLDVMVQEDAEHPVIGDEELAKLEPQKQVKELIFRLRDQNGHQQVQPGSCDIFLAADLKQDRNAPASQLADMRYAAVPQLIEALDDKHLSRSVGFWRDFTFSHTALTVGDCAQQILERIAGQRFYSSSTTSAYMSIDNAVESTKKAASAWWKSVQDKGEKETLVEYIAEGTKDPTAAVTQLKAKYPDAVAEALLRGSAKTKDEWHSTVYLGAMNDARSPAVTEYLIKRMSHDSTLSLRLMAAEVLWHQGYAGSIPAMITEWQSVVSSPRSADEGAFTDLMRFLAHSGKANAVSALVRSADQLHARNRSWLVLSLGTAFGKAAWQSADRKSQAPEPAAEETAEWFLVHELENTSALEGWSTFGESYDFPEARMCDFALWWLHHIDAKRFPLAIQADRKQRDAERMAVIKVWRETHKPPVSPFESPPEVKKGTER